jgi:uncharacterized protein with HEPN domain
MRSDENSEPLWDIRRNIELAQSFIADLNYEEFRSDRRTVYAVIRCLEIISEASRKLSADLKARHPDLPWPDIAGAGNVYRHDYEDVLDQMVWHTVRALEPLAEVVVTEINKLLP